LKEYVNHLGDQTNIRDLLNPPGMFKDGKRQKEYSKNYVLPASGRLLPEFDLDKRRNIKDMFARKPKSISSNSEDAVSTPAATPGSQTMENGPVAQDSGSGKSGRSVAAYTTDNIHTSQTTPRKRSQPSSTAFSKRSKPAPVTSSGTSTGNQKTLKGFFKPKTTNDVRALHHSMALPISDASSPICQTSKTSQEDEVASAFNSQTPQEDIIPTTREGQASIQSTKAGNFNDDDFIVDPIVSKEDWSKLFTKKPAPSCDGHKEPCISLTTKKPGMNRGRLFWICSRPLGPNGEKEKGTQWRCPTFIWASDWNSSAGSQE
jgi:AP endonuclease-2